ncbi:MULTISPECIES: phage major capsid protein [unclassified Breznakia]|uniref:phage major capsid protein n=1 Tax=unclassified Breznakia TaxID=2623764 RepID=UPI002472F68C|nr:MULTISPECIES: phage major capsid protein [unclassified Breznakia]MDH6367139.1 HK97 family phage major capsid protein [Breznakia sp. PH1-1]MDH6404274.1 HK97 family phage major capsid protein [Breznakia sp. PF1-11]MDH6412027.1 HK97 family phage major capsid protein [Breznakia sp. PFB1-11]MDH6414262.1 HK97 family phage major capsid protein [Breznakia sp. PFB1-14]MDH6416641.1 HK97 family phage major capsid protein [Breznakia sp. PFB1-4]
MLKKLKLAKQKEMREKQLSDLLEREAELKTREAELEDAISEAETDEDLETVNEEVEKLNTEKDEATAAKTKLEDEIRDIETQLDELEDKSKEVKNEERKNAEKKEVREMKTGYEYLQNEEVRSFYGNVAKAVLDKRAVTGTDLLIPDVVVNRIESKITEYSKLIGEVEVIDLNGNARVITAGDIPTAIWMECCDPVAELADAFDQIELDCYKVGGFIPVCNATLDDSFVALANILEERLAKAIAKAIDIAIAKGTGVKQPTGMMLNAVDGGTVTSIKDLLPLVAKVNSEEVVKIYMSKTTLLSRVAPELLLATADGKYFVNMASFAGYEFVTSDAFAVDEFVIGAGKEYLLGRRKGVTLATSTDVRFIEDQTVFKATARYDGKPKKNDAFVKGMFATPAQG